MSDAIGLTNDQSINSLPISSLFGNYAEIDVTYGSGTHINDIYSQLGNYINGICRVVAKTDIVFQEQTAGTYGRIAIGLISGANATQTITNSQTHPYFFDINTNTTITKPNKIPAGAIFSFFSFQSLYRVEKTLKLSSLAISSSSIQPSIFVNSSNCYLNLIYYNGQSWHIDSGVVTLQFWW